jgi:hypothetical protein
VIIGKTAFVCNPAIASKTGDDMAERVSAIPTCKHLIWSHFLSFSDFTPHFTPHNFLSIVAFKWHGSFVSGVTDAVLQPAFDFQHGGRGLKEPGLRLSDRGSTMGWQRL